MEGGGRGKIWKNKITRHTAHTWLPAMEESDSSLIPSAFLDSKNPAAHRAGPREPHFSTYCLPGSVGKVV